MDASLFQKVYDVNLEQIDYVVGQVKNMGVKSGSKVGVLGLSFKPGTSDMRVSPAGRLCKALAKEGYNVLGYDPQAVEEARLEFPEEENLKYVEDMDEVFKDSDIVILATDWPEFKELDYEKLSGLMKSKKFYDSRNCLDREKMNKIFKFDNLGA